MATGKSGTLDWVSGNYTVRVNWSETYNESANTSNITIDSIQVKSSSSSNIGFWTNGSIKINGTTVKQLNSSTPVGYVYIGYTNTFYEMKENGATNASQLTCGLSNIAHDSDGSKSINIELNIEFRTTSGQTKWSVAGSKSITLTTFAKSSTITSASNVTLGSNCSIKWTPASSSFKYKITFSLGSWSYTTGFISPGTTNSYTYTGYTIPVSALPSSTSGTMTATLTTYDSNGSQVGSPSSKTFTVSISSSSGYGISVGTITLDPVDINGYNYLVQGKNKLQISVSGSTASSGSYIQSYTFDGPGISTTTTASSVTSTNSITASGILTYTVTVTDSRGFSASKTATIQCYEYEQPSFTSFNAYRVASSSSTEANDKGTYLRCTYNLKYSSVNNTNAVDIKIFYKKSSASSWSSVSVATSSTNTSGVYVLSSIEAGSTYSVYAQITDRYEGFTSSNQNTMFGESRIFNIRPSGTGIAFGKMADEDNLLECAWPAKFDNGCEIVGNNGLKVGSSTQSSPPTSGIAVHDVRSATITPNSFGNKNVNFYLHNQDGEKSIMHMKGLDGNYAAWELAGNASNSTNSSLLYRQGVGNTWGNWQTVITDENINDYVDLGSNTTFTEGLTLPSEFEYVDGKYGVNCNSSDLININGLYFDDIDCNSGEGINFSNGNNWNTIYTYGDDLYYQYDRTTDEDLWGDWGYIIYHDGHFQLDTGTCTLQANKSNAVTVWFDKWFEQAPAVMLTLLTSSDGVLVGKVMDVTTEYFTAFLATNNSAYTTAQFSWLAVNA